MDVVGAVSTRVRIVGIIRRFIWVTKQVVNRGGFVWLPHHVVFLRLLIVVNAHDDLTGFLGSLRVIVEVFEGITFLIRAFK